MSVLGVGEVLRKPDATPQIAPTLARGMSGPTLQARSGFRTNAIGPARCLPAGPVAVCAGARMWAGDAWQRAAGTPAGHAHARCEAPPRGPRPRRPLGVAGGASERDRPGSLMGQRDENERDTSGSFAICSPFSKESGLFSGGLRLVPKGGLVEGASALRQHVHGFALRDIGLTAASLVSLRAQKTTVSPP